MSNEKVAAYPRISRDTQTLEQQKTAIIRHYPDETKFDWYTETTSGWEGKQPQYEILLKNIERGAVKEVCACSIDRLGRNTRKAFYFVDLCINKGVKLVTLSQNIDWTGPFGRSLYCFFAEIAQMESDNKSDRLKRKFAQQKIDEEFVPHGNIPGSVSRRNKEVSATVYDMLDSGKSYRTIAMLLSISVNSVETIAHRRGLWLYTRAEFALKHPNWYRLSREELYALCGMDCPPLKKRQTPQLRS